MKILTFLFELSCLVLIAWAMPLAERARSDHRFRGSGSFWSPDRRYSGVFWAGDRATWKNRPGIGLFIHAVKSGQKPSVTKPGCGWKEWADEAVKRRLMEYSQSHDGDIMVHLVGGVSRLWSQLRSSPWSDVERVAAGETP